MPRGPSEISFLKFYREDNEISPQNLSNGILNYLYKYQ